VQIFQTLNSCPKLSKKNQVFELLIQLLLQPKARGEEKKRNGFRNVLQQILLQLSPQMPNAALKAAEAPVKAADARGRPPGTPNRFSLIALITAFKIFSCNERTDHKSH
jgi:hypothetical protein